MLIAFILLWIISGSSGFIYWWTTEFDLKASEIPMCIFSGLIGPLSWILGYFIHDKNENGTPKIIFRKRKK